MAGEYLQDWQTAVNDQIDFGKNAYLEAIPDLAYSIEAARGIGGLQTRAAMDQAALSEGLAKRRVGFNAMEDQYATDAFGYNSDARKEQAAAAAGADVSSQFNKQHDQTMRQAARMGVNPNSGKYAATDAQMGMAQATASAQAGNKARQDIDAVADAKQKTAIGFGKDLSTQSTQAAQSAAYAGNAAMATETQPLKDRLNFAGGVSNIYSNGINGYKDLWGTSNLTAAQQAGLDSASADRSSSEDNAMWGAAGAVLGSKTGSDLVNQGLKYIGLL